MYTAPRKRTFCSNSCRKRYENNRHADRHRAITGQDDAAPSEPSRIGERKLATKYFEAAPCEGPGCTNIIPASPYSTTRKRVFCSDACRRLDTTTRYVAGTCACGCEQPILGHKHKSGRRKFVDSRHYHRFRRERQLAETGIFRPVIERYLAGDAKTYYSPSTLPMVQASLA